MRRIVRTQRFSPALIGGNTMRRLPLRVVFAVLAALVISACSDSSPTSPSSSTLGPSAGGSGTVGALDKPSDEEFCPDGVTPRDPKGHCHGDDTGDGGTVPDTFDVSVSSVSPTAGVEDWGAGVMRDAGSGNWFHVFDSGGSGTRGNPNFANAAFFSKILFGIVSGPTSDTGGCLGDMALSRSLSE